MLFNTHLAKSIFRFVQVAKLLLIFNEFVLCLSVCQNVNIASNKWMMTDYRIIF
jgi:hypothetical protein